MDMIRTLKVSEYRTTQAIKYNKLFLFLYYTNYRKVFFLLFIRSIIYIYIYITNIVTKKSTRNPLILYNLTYKQFWKKILQE